METLKITISNDKENLNKSNEIQQEPDKSDLQQSQSNPLKLLDIKQQQQNKRQSKFSFYQLNKLKGMASRLKKSRQFQQQSNNKQIYYLQVNGNISENRKKQSFLQLKQSNLQEEIRNSKLVQKKQQIPIVQHDIKSILKALQNFDLQIRQLTPEQRLKDNIYTQMGKNNNNSSRNNKNNNSNKLQHRRNSCYCYECGNQNHFTRHVQNSIVFKNSIIDIKQHFREEIRNVLKVEKQIQKQKELLKEEEKKREEQQHRNKINNLLFFRKNQQNYTNNIIQNSPKGEEQQFQSIESIFKIDKNLIKNLSQNNNENKNKTAVQTSSKKKVGFWKIKKQNNDNDNNNSNNNKVPIEKLKKQVKLVVIKQRFGLNNKFNSKYYEVLDQIDKDQFTKSPRNAKSFTHFESDSVIQNNEKNIFSSSSKSQVVNSFQGFFKNAQQGEQEQSQNNNNNNGFIQQKKSENSGGFFGSLLKNSKNNEQEQQLQQQQMQNQENNNNIENKEKMSFFKKKKKSNEECDEINEKIKDLQKQLDEKQNKLKFVDDSEDESKSQGSKSNSSQNQQELINQQQKDGILEKKKSLSINKKRKKTYVIKKSQNQQNQNLSKENVVLDKYQKDFNRLNKISDIYYKQKDLRVKRYKKKSFDLEQINRGNIHSNSYNSKKNNKTVQDNNNIKDILVNQDPYQLNQQQSKESPRKFLNKNNARSLGSLYNFQVQNQNQQNSQQATQRIPTIQDMKNEFILNDVNKLEKKEKSEIQYLDNQQQQQNYQQQQQQQQNQNKIDTNINNNNKNNLKKGYNLSLNLGFLDEQPISFANTNQQQKFQVYQSITPRTVQASRQNTIRNNNNKEYMLTEREQQKSLNGNLSVKNTRRKFVFNNNSSNSNNKVNNNKFIKINNNNIKSNEFIIKSKKSNGNVGLQQNNSKIYQKQVTEPNIIISDDNNQSLQKSFRQKTLQSNYNEGNSINYCNYFNDSLQKSRQNSRSQQRQQKLKKQMVMYKIQK